MAKNKNNERWRERGITSTALAAAHVEAPGPGAERKTQAAVTGGAGTPTGAVSRGRAAQRFEDFDGREFEALILAAASSARARYVRTTVRCPLCGKLLRRRSAASHALTHIEKLERAGVLRLERENGGWVVVTRDGLRLRGASWLTLVKLAEVVNGG
jgi:hypothetical protein